MWSNCVLGTTLTKRYLENFLLKRSCVYGVITDKTENEVGDTVFNILPLDEPIIFLTLVKEYEILREIYPGAVGILTTADVGECIVVVGYPFRTEGGHFCYWA